MFLVVTWWFFRTRTAIDMITIAATMMNTIATTPPMVAAVLPWDVLYELGSLEAVGGWVGLILEDVVSDGNGGIGGEHSSSFRIEMATEQPGSTLISTPVTMILGPPFTHSSIREMRESLSVSEVPSSLARYVTNDGDFLKQENDCLSIMPLLHSVQKTVSCSITARAMSDNFRSLSVL